MPRQVKPLSARQVENAKGGLKTYRLFDGGGLYLEVTDSGSRYWRLKYRFGGKEKLLALGVFPDVSLRDARDEREKARALVRAGIDPCTYRKQEKLDRQVRAENTFEIVAREWIEKRRETWTAGHAANVLSAMEADVFPKLGARPIAEIEAAEFLDCVQAIERRGALDVASRAAQRCASVVRYGVLTGRCKVNPAAELRGVVKARKVQHRTALPREELPGFLKNLDNYNGRPETRIAVILQMLTFVRPGELRGARWSEVDFERAVWRIPAERMKMQEEHVVPLSRQALVAFRELHAITGRGDFSFPHYARPDRTMSENTVTYALYRMGYHSRATGHGFRALASTCLNEMGFRPDVIERQLAHAERNKVRAAYNRAQYLKERRELMQAWADFVDAQRDDGVSRLKAA